MSTRLPPVLATPFVSQTRPMKGSGPVREERRLQQTRDPYKALQVVIPRQKQFERLSSQPASSFTPYDPQKGFHEVLPEEGGKRKYKDGSDAFNSNPVPKRVKQNLNKLDLNRQIPDVKSLKEFKSIMEEYKRESIPLDELTYRKISTLMGVASGALAVEILEWIANEGGSYGVNPLIFMCTNAVKKASFQQIFLIFEIITNKIKHVDSNGFKCLLKGIGSAIENSPTGEAAMEIITGLKDKKLNIRGEAFPLDIISCIAALKKQKLNGIKAILNIIKENDIRINEEQFSIVLKAIGTAIENSQTGADALEIVQALADGTLTIQNKAFRSDKVLRLEISHCNSALKKQNLAGIKHILRIINNNPQIRIDKKDIDILSKAIGCAIENSQTGADALEIVQALIDGALKIRNQAFQSDEVLKLDIIQCTSALKSQNLTGIRYILGIIGSKFHSQCNEGALAFLQVAIGTAIEKSQTGADALEIVQALADGTLTIQNKAFRSDKVLRLEISHCNSALKKQNLAGIKHILRIINSNPKIRVDKKDIDILSKAIGTAIENSQTGADALEIVQALIDGTLKIRNQAFQSDEVFTLDIIQCISALKSQNLTGIRYILGIIGSKFHSQCSERALSFLQMAIGVAIEKSQTGADALEVVQALADGTLTIQNKAFQLDEVLKLTIIQCTSALKKQNLAGIKHILRIITSNPQIRIDKKDIDILSKAIGCAIKNSQTGADALEITEWLSTRPHIKEEIFLELGSEACATFLKQQDAAGIKKIWELMLIQNIPVDELFYKALTICIQNQISSVKIIEILDYVKTSTILAPLPKSEQCLTRFILANTACERAVELGDAINVVAYVLSDSDPFYHPSVTHSKACFKFYPKVSILSIDCHGFSKTLALEYLRTMLVSLEEPDKKEGISGLEFIPGKGIHSNHAPYALKDAIVAMMKGYPQWERAAQPNQGCLMYRRRNTEPLPVMSTSTPLPTR